MNDMHEAVFADGLYKTPELLEEAIEKVNAFEGTLGVRGLGASNLETALTTLNDDKVEMGKPDVFRITDNSFYNKKFAIPVDLTHAFATYSFLYVEFPVGLKTKSNWSFNKYRLLIEFTDRDAKVIDMLPSDRFKELLKVKGNFQVGIDTSLSFRASMPDMHLPAGGADVSGRAEAGVDAGARLDFIKPPFEYSIRQWEVKTEGRDLYYMDWEFSNIEEDTKNESRSLKAILRIPKSLRELHMNATLVAYRNPDSVKAALTSLFHSFSETLQSWFNKGVPIPFHTSQDLLANLQQEI